MSLEAEIHTQWAAKSALAGLLPVERVFTGRAPPDTSLPYAVLSLMSSRPVMRTSEGESVVDSLVRFNLYTSRFDEGSSIAATISSKSDGFLNAAFSFDGGEVLDVRPGNERRFASPQGVWTIDVELHFRVRRAGA
ncbi:MAG TPA: DUF3168 domain-containing protein [Pirellulales bacterium]